MIAVFREVLLYSDLLAWRPNPRFVYSARGQGADPPYPALVNAANGALNYSRYFYNAYGPSTPKPMHYLLYAYIMGFGMNKE